MIAGIIPARFASQRFPGKPLARLDGKTIIQHVYERASACEELEKVVVATDDKRILDEVTSFGGEALMTSDHHRNGTERCSEVASQLSAKYVVNIQGDEPLIEPNQIQTVCQLLLEGNQIATLKKRIDQEQEVRDPNVVKVVTSLEGYAMYFSRSVIPHEREQSGITHYRHIGLYGFESDTLQQLVKLPVTALERAESLEQLRWLENGYRIRVAETAHEAHGVDTPEDLIKLQTLVNERKNA